MEDIILTIHSINRWLIVVVAAVSMVKFLIGWLGQGPFKPIDNRLMRIFTVLIDLQLLLGILLLFYRGTARYQLEHAFIMLLTVIVVHLSARWRNAEDRIKFRNYFLTIAAALIIIIVGVTLLPQGWLG